MRILTYLSVTLIMPATAALSASAPPLLIAPSPSTVPVTFEDDQTRIRPQNLTIGEIARAARPGDAMVLCLRFGPNRLAEFRLMNARFSSVAAALKAQGAPLVFTDGLCPGAVTSPPLAKATVEIHRLAPAK